MQSEPASIGSFDPDLDARLKACLQRYGAPGAVVAMVAGDGRIFASGYGVKALSRTEPVTLRTAFNVGSTSKAFAATTAAVLIHQGRMSWDDPVRRWLPDFLTWREDESARMTIRDLSANRAGLPRNGFLEFGTELTIPAEEVVRRLRYAPPAAALGERFTYSNIGHTTVALVIEAVTGRPYAEVLAEQVLRPLGMDDSAAGVQARNLPDLSGWHCASDGATRELSPIFTDVHRGSAGVCVTGADASRWLAFNLGDGGPLMSTAALQELHTRQIVVDERDHAIWIAPPEAVEAGYALGWGTSREGDISVSRHSGSDFGINAHVLVSRDAGVGAAVYVNKDCKASIEINYMVFDALMGRRSRDWGAVVHDKRLPDTNASFRHSAKRPAGENVVDPSRYAGVFRSAREGAARIFVDGGSLRAAFADAPVFNGALTPLPAGLFLLEPDYAGLVSDAVGGRFEAEFVFADGTPMALDIHGIGRFDREA